MFASNALSLVWKWAQFRIRSLVSWTSGPCSKRGPTRLLNAISAHTWKDISKKNGIWFELLVKAIEYRNTNELCLIPAKPCICCKSELCVRHCRYSWRAWQWKTCLKNKGRVWWQKLGHSKRRKPQISPQEIRIPYTDDSNHKSELPLLWPESCNPLSPYSARRRQTYAASPRPG